MKFKGMILLFTSMSLLMGCSPASSNESGTTESHYFKNVAESIEAGISEETLFQTFYDNDDNRFYVELYYDFHFNLSLRIVEYDLWNFILYPSEGVISEDYEQITFKYMANERSELFTKGTYVLKHELVDKVDKFTLDAAGEQYTLTVNSKEDPHYIDKDLVGEFEYIVSNVTEFTLTVNVGTKAEHYPVTISLKEGSKSFSGSNIQNSETSTSFDISGDADGTYVKSASNVRFVYSENNETYKITILGNTYSLKKTKGMDEEEEDSNFFIDNATKIKFVCDDFEAKLSNTSPGRVFIMFKELVEGGNTNFWCWFETNKEADTVVNTQSITSQKNKIFTGVTEYKFKHTVVNNEDKVDLYFDSVLVYENLNIVPIE